MAKVTSSEFTSGLLYNTDTGGGTCAAGSGNDVVVLTSVIQRTATPSSIVSVTCGGVAMNHIRRDIGSSHTIDYYQLPVGNNPGNKTILATLTSGLAIVWFVYGHAFDGRSQSTPVNISANENGAGQVGAGPEITPTVDGCDISAVILEESNNIPTAVAHTNDMSDDYGGYCVSQQFYSQAVAATTQMDWTLSQSNQQYNSTAIALAPAVTNSAPTIFQDTPDSSDFTTGTPSLEFTGSDGDGDPLEYQIQITDNPDEFVGGTQLEDHHEFGTSFGMHLQPGIGTSWDGYPLTDDAPGQSFTGNGGVLESVEFICGVDEDPPTNVDGIAYARVYPHQGVFGTSSEPLNPADPGDTPTPGWIAESDGVVFFGAVTSEWKTFNFSGANRIRLEAGVRYVVIIRYQANNSLESNNIVFFNDSADGHAGNLYNDGGSVVNNGPQSGWDAFFRVNESYILLDKSSDVDSGFVNEVDGGDTHPFTEGQKVSYTVQALDELDITSYFWRVKADDGSLQSTWSSTRTFDVLEDTGSRSGTLNETLEDATLSATGEVYISGVLNETEGSDTLVATGEVDISASTTAQLEDDTLVATGEVDILASTTAQLEDDILVATGEVDISASTTAQLEDDTLAATGEVDISASTTAQLEDDTLAATGEVDISASITAQLEDDTLVATGEVDILASTTAQLEDDALDATGVISAEQETFGVLNVTAGDDALIAAGEVDISAFTIAQLEDDTLVATGEVDISASMTVQLEDDTLIATGIVSDEPEIFGVLNETLEDDALVATGEVDVSASTTAQLEDDMLVSSGIVSTDQVSGYLNESTNDDVLVATGEVYVAASTTVQLEDDSISSMGEVLVDGSLTVTLGDDTLIATNIPLTDYPIPNGRRYLISPSDRVYKVKSSNRWYKVEP